MCDGAVISESDAEDSILVPFSSHFCPDPKTLSFGSPRTAPARSGPQTQDVVFSQLPLLLYIVLRPRAVTRRAAADIAALLIPSPWYTSGYSEYQGKSDPVKSPER